MKFVKITDLNKCEDVKTLYHQSFPPEEQVKFDSLFSGVFTGYLLYALYEGDELVAMVHFKQLPNFVHVNYLAVKKEWQSKGYGSACLTFVKNQFSTYV